MRVDIRARERRARSCDDLAQHRSHVLKILKGFFSAVLDSGGRCRAFGLLDAFLRIDPWALGHLATFGYI